MVVKQRIIGCLKIVDADLKWVHWDICLNLMFIKKARIGSAIMRYIVVAGIKLSKFLYMQIYTFFENYASDNRKCGSNQMEQKKI